jgi:nitroimidazol reductase NimA-like FMN-containing flavoprotein (pyridoxamine 5'-phosphate oxidase superfamily)
MNEENDLPGQLRELLEDQRLAVISTRTGDQPYSNLICFVASNDLRYILFATTRATRKYANLMKESQIALLVDNRSHGLVDPFRALALTALGKAVELKGTESAQALGIYIARHPHMQEFVSSPSTALFRMNVEKYILVRRFQDVMELQVTL